MQRGRGIAGEISLFSGIASPAASDTISGNRLPCMTAFPIETMSQPDLPLSEIILRRSTPVVINSFNQLTYVKNMVAKLREARFGNLYILDQASTYPPLRAWLAGVHERGEALPLYSPANKGPHDFFLSQTYKLFGGGPVIYTDPDLSWTQLAPDFLTRMFAIAHRYRIFKVGPALTIPAPAETKPGLRTVLDRGIPMDVAEYESRYWVNEVEPGVYNSPIDTTMHLFIPEYYAEGSPLITGLRVAGEGYSVLHLPWFANDPMPQEEYDFYLRLSRHTSWQPEAKTAD
jgi:hypothetical protein